MMMIYLRKEKKKVWRWNEAIRGGTFIFTFRNSNKRGARSQRRMGAKFFPCHSAPPVPHTRFHFFSFSMFWHFLRFAPFTRPSPWLAWAITTGPLPSPINSLIVFPVEGSKNMALTLPLFSLRILWNLVSKGSSLFMLWDLPSPPPHSPPLFLIWVTQFGMPSERRLSWR